GTQVAFRDAPSETTPKPDGLKRYETWIKKSGGPMNENSSVGWLNADLFVRGLKAAGCDFTRQKVIDAVNQMTNYNADGILPAVDWTKAHTQAPGCFAYLKVPNAKFKPVFGQAGEPFLRFPAALTSIPQNPQAVG